jgi:DNA anti-recombination protein RmuC
VTVTSHLAADVASKGLMFGLAFHRGIDRAFANAAVRREQAAHSVDELALRLQEAREDEAAALEAAAAMAAELAQARAEAARLRAQLTAERQQRAHLQAAFEALCEECAA